MNVGLGYRGARVVKSLILVSLFIFSLFSMMPPQPELDAEVNTFHTPGQETLLWGETVSGSSSTDSVESIEMDAYGNTYVCGYFYNNARFGNINLVAMGSTDGYVGKIGPSGNWLWVEKMGGSSSDYCYDIDVDDGGNISITGAFYSQASFGSTYLSSQGGYDIFVAKLDTNGTWQWAIKGGGSSSDYGYGVAIDNSGNVYATGYFYTSGTIYFGSSTISGHSYDDSFVAKINSAGQVQWAHRMYGSYYQRGRGIDVNDNGEIAVVGEFSYQLYPEGSGGSCSTLSPSYNHQSYYRLFVVKYTTTGNCVWSAMAGYLQSSYSSHGEDVVIDNSGAVSVAGRFQYLMDFQTNGANRLWTYQQGNNWDCFVAQWTPAGSYSWAQNVGGSSTDYCWAIDVDESSGNVTIAGEYHSSTAWLVIPT